MQDSNDVCRIAVEWAGGQPEGRIEVFNGCCREVTVVRGAGEVEGAAYRIPTEAPCRLQIDIGDADLTHGASPTMVTVQANTGAFTVLLRDVRSECPVYIPSCGAVVLPADDHRTYAEVEAGVRALGLRTSLQVIESEPEESYGAAAAHTRDLHCPTWLGLGRDMRIFEVAYAHETPMHVIRPRYHGYPVVLPQTADQPAAYSFHFSRGEQCVDGLARRLEEGVLPILRGTLQDDDVAYDLTAFVSPERSSLTRDGVRGTHYLAADVHGGGHMLTPEQQAQCDALLPAELEREEETVLCHRVEAVNTGRAPRYAWFKCPQPNGAYRFDGSRGHGCFEDGGLFVAARLNGAPLPKEEVAVLLRPGETATFDFALFHRPVPAERADVLASIPFETRLEECRDFWRAKLSAAAHVSLPERRVDEMLRAGLLHLDVVAYGMEPDGPVAATIGVYCPIGSESSPIIQAMDSFGWHDLAERSLEYFLEKQHDDGFIQNFGGYMLETGAALWSMGEHYRYTRNDAWVRRIAPRVRKACDYLLAWRARNQKEEFRGRGYGLIEGKVADPEDPFHAFMLNGFAVLGLARAAEMLAAVDPAESARLAHEAAAYQEDVRAALKEAVDRSPVVPLQDGTWCPSVPPWAEARGPVSLLTDAERWFTHGAFTARDSLIGPIHLILHEVLTPGEPLADLLVNTHADLFHVRNVAPSQPYYSTHAYAHLRRGAVKPFLKAYYNGFAGLADRQTYTFWEHYFHASPHKTHEEGWFLMQTRWMLWMEEEQTLHLLPGIPRAWLADGQRIALDGVATYFGPAWLRVEPHVDQNRITATVRCDGPRRPERVGLRLPHPQGRRAVCVEGGTYDSATESVLIEPFTGAATVVLGF